MGKILSHLAEGQMESLFLKYEGDVAGYNTEILKASLLKGLIERVVEERVNLVNAVFLARSRGIKVVEQKESACEHYSSLITAEVTTSQGRTVIAGTVMRGESHIVRVNEYWMDFIPQKGYWLFSDHLDRPGLIGAVGTVTGSYDINISSMLVARQRPRGQALMILSLDEPLPEEARQKILSIPDVYTAKVVKL